MYLCINRFVTIVFDKRDIDESVLEIKEFNRVIKKKMNYIKYLLKIQNKLWISACP